MIGEVIQCQNAGCEISFTKKTHNQRYHDDECCRLATNAKIMEKYYARRAQRLGITRFCDKCSVTKLSRYNNNSTCNSCLLSSQVARSNAVVNMLSVVSI